MAIIVEEKRNSGSIVNFLTWIAVLAITAASVYYIFFKNPELVEFTASPSFKNVQQLSKININPQELLDNAAFQALKQYVTLTPPQNLGRSNPFLGF
ncbi:MAG: hypothetical protein HY433_00175 [Candidatus Liptonbacteria bacterium]|nr:hypothetical protein [Candidatus Liptonbacteria bacterium]